MRTLVVFALALIGTAVFTSDASAFGKRNRGGAGCFGSVGYGCGGYGGHSGYGCSGYTHGGYSHGAVGHGCSGYSVGGGSPGYSSGHFGAYPGVSFGSSSGSGSLYSSSSPTTNGKPATVQGTDGQYYTLGADGYYYASSGGASVMTGGYRPQSYYGTGMYSPGYYATPRGYSSYYPSSYYPTGVYPAGYPGGYYGPGVVPAGGAQLMPGVTVSPGGITIVPGAMPPRR